MATGFAKSSTQFFGEGSYDSVSFNTFIQSKFNLASRSFKSWVRLGFSILVTVYKTRRVRDEYVM